MRRGAKAISLIGASLLVAALSPRPVLDSPRPVPAAVFSVVLDLERQPSPGEPVPLPPQPPENAKSLVFTLEMEGDTARATELVMMFGRSRTYFADPDQLRIKLTSRSGSVVGEIRTWDPRSRFIYELRDELPTKVEWGANGQTLMMAIGRIVRVLRPLDGQERVVIPLRSPYDAIELSPNGTSLLAIVGQRAHVFNAENGSELADLSSLGPVAHAAYAPDGSEILLWGGNVARILDARDHRVLSTAELGGPIDGAAWNEEGSAILAWSGADLWIWDARLVERARRSQRAPLRGAAWRPTGNDVVSWTAEDLEIWTISSGSAVQVELEETPLGVAWNMDGSRLAAWSEVAVYVFAIGEPAADRIARFYAENLVRSVGWTDDDFLVVVGPASAQYATPAGETVKQVTLPDEILTFDLDSNQGRLVLLSTTDAAIYEMPSGRRLATIEHGSRPFEERFVVSPTAAARIAVPFVPELAGVSITDNRDVPYTRIDLVPTIQSFCNAHRGDEQCRAWLDER